MYLHLLLPPTQFSASNCLDIGIRFCIDYRLNMFVGQPWVIQDHFHLASDAPTIPIIWYVVVQIKLQKKCFSINFTWKSKWKKIYTRTTHKTLPNLQYTNTLNMHNMFIYKTQTFDDKRNKKWSAIENKYFIWARSIALISNHVQVTGGHFNSHLFFYWLHIKFTQFFFSPQYWQVIINGEKIASRLHIRPMSNTSKALRSSEKFIFNGICSQKAAD